MKQYCYCSVQPKGVGNTYYYISDEEIKINSFVKIPFGSENIETIGVVRNLGYYDEDNVPFPIEKTKRVICTVSSDEYDRYPGFYAAAQNETTYEDYELEEVTAYIENEDFDSMFDWACLHHDCINSPEIMDMVCRCYELCMEEGNPKAALNLGTLYYNGTYLPRDFSKAAQLYETAAKAGERRAICNLGYCYYYGRHQQVDYQKAYEYFNLAVLLYDDPNSLYKLGDMYKLGKYVEENEIFATRLYFRALNAVMRKDEDKYCLPDIQFRIGKIFLEGESVENDPQRALEFLTNALNGFYSRRKTDSFVSSLIVDTKKLISKAADALDKEII